MTGAVQGAAPGRSALAIVCAAAAAELPSWVDAAAGANGLTLVRVPDLPEALNTVRRGRPPLVILDARQSAGITGRALLLALKADAYTAVVPCIAITDTAGPQLVSLLDAGADEVLAADGDHTEALARVAGALRRSVRDLSAQPTTRLPAAVAIEREIPGLLAIAPSASSSVTAVYGNLNWPTSVTGVDSSYLDVRGYTIDQGRTFSDNEITGGVPVCILGKTVKDNLFGEASPLGQRVRLNRISCLVVGLLVSKGQAAMGGDQDDTVPAEMGRHLARSIPGCRASFYPREGHHLLYHRWREILTPLARSLGAVPERAATGDGTERAQA